ncbi:MAG: alkyl hydroperoxide reductase subunit F [Marinifilaceae bacterium]|jgi:alkyl hydroperoxide reductase subunit F|nr:alkyl hydroperoxide reductase subunit F [Marinifilaceae bacterium]
MLDNNLKAQVKELFKQLKNNYVIDVQVSDIHSAKNELVELLEDFVDCSDKIDLKLEAGDDLCFKIKSDKQENNILFRAVPNGHEFTSLLLAILNMDGVGKNIPDDLIQNKIKQIDKEIVIKSYISLSCTNCPEVVQALNLMSILNPKIKHEIIDGGINKDEIEKYSIQSVPSVYINDEVLHIGRSNLSGLLEKLYDKLDIVASQEVIEREYDVLVAGGGPAGVSAAIYSARKGFKVGIVADKIGGQVNETQDIENMISIKKTTGKQLSSDMNRHLNDYPIDIIDNRSISKVEIVDGYKHIETKQSDRLISPALIVATGASWRKLGIPGEDQYMGSGVAFCTHCDGPFYKNKDVVVVGGGNSGIEAAIDLANIANNVTVLEFMPNLKADQVLVDKLNQMKNVKVITNAESKKIEGDGSKLTSIEYRDRQTDEIVNISTDGVFVQIGLIPNSQLFSDITNTNKFGEIEIDYSCRTSTAGVYAAGDVTTVPYKQIVIAMGEGSKAALSAFEDNMKNKLLS